FLLLEAISDFRRSAAPRPRILIPRSFFFDDVDPRIVELVREAASRLGETETVDAGNPDGTWDANTVILLSDAVAFHERRLREHPDWFGGALAERMSRGFEIRGIDYARAKDVQREWTEFLTTLLGDHSVLAAPTTPIPATTIGDREGAELARVMTRLTATTAVGAVHLRVRDLDRAIGFYTEGLGLRLQGREGDVARLGAWNSELLVLVGAPGAAKPRGTTGLYHFALLVPSRRDLARSLRHLIARRVPLTGMSDHSVSESLYLS